jgi:hypothetical protein
MVTKNDSHGLPQPLLRGINIAQFLCESCPFYQNTRQDTEMKDAAKKREVGRPSPSGFGSVDDGPADHSGLPGRL